MTALELSTLFASLQDASVAVRWSISEVDANQSNSSRLNKLVESLESLKSIFSEFQDGGEDVSRSAAVQETLARLLSTTQSISDFMSTLKELNTDGAREKLNEFHHDLTGPIVFFQTEVQKRQLANMKILDTELQRNTEDLASNYQSIIGNEKLPTPAPTAPLQLPPWTRATIPISNGDHYSGDYSGYYTYGGISKGGLMRLRIEFSTQPSGHFKVRGGGKDELGTFTVENGHFSPSSGNITFSKRYVDCNDGQIWHYKGQYEKRQFIGSWGDDNQSFGTFSIKRDDTKKEEQSFAGPWSGHYYYDSDGNRNDGIVRIDMKAKKSSAGVTISGSGSDGVGTFVIQKGQVSVDGSVSFVKRYTNFTQPGVSWEYQGRMDGWEMKGRWGRNGRSYGTFLMWKD